MTKIQEIEQQLAQAKKEEQTSYLNKDFEEIKKQYEGKCFGTHTFERNSKAAYCKSFSQLQCKIPQFNYHWANAGSWFFKGTFSRQSRAIYC